MKLIPPTRDLCHSLQMAALRHGWQIRCDGRWLYLVRSVAAAVTAGVLAGEITLVVGMWLI